MTLMFEKYKNASQLSCKNILDGRYIDKANGWTDIDDDDFRYEIFKLFREYVAKTARGNRRQRIFNVERKRVEYCCGQEWNSEMAILRDCFD